MPGPYSPQDNIISPIIHQIALTIQSQIPSIGFVWEKGPSRAPSDNEVLLQFVKGQVMSDTNGKMKLKLTISARHVFRPTEREQVLIRAYSYVYPWLAMLDAWPNQTLGGNAMETNPTSLSVLSVTESGQVFIALAVAFDVLTEFNISLT